MLFARIPNISRDKGRRNSKIKYPSYGQGVGGQAKCKIIMPTVVPSADVPKGDNLKFKNYFVKIAKRYHNFDFCVLNF